MKIVVAAMGCIVNSSNEILLALRNDPLSPKVHHKWQLPGGGVEDCETIQEAVVREVKEETGLNVSIALNKAAVSFGVINERKHATDTRILLIGYLCNITGGTLGGNISEETAKLQWFSYNSIPWKHTLPGNEEVIKELTKD